MVVQARSGLPVEESDSDHGFEEGLHGAHRPRLVPVPRSRARLDEVNFWQPHGEHNFRALSSGDPFFFKLRAPARHIAGFGFFQRFQQLSARDAWDYFGDANGAPTFEDMIHRLSPLRQEPTPASGEFRIGCIMIAAPVFFVPDESGASAGRLGQKRSSRARRTTSVRARATVFCVNASREPRVVCTTGTSIPTRRWWRRTSGRYGAAVEVHPRLGQGLFSLAVRDAYHAACAVTGSTRFRRSKPRTYGPTVWKVNTGWTMVYCCAATYTGSTTGAT